MRRICNGTSAAKYTRKNIWRRNRNADWREGAGGTGREREHFNELSWHHKFHKRKYLPSKRIAPLAFFLSWGEGRGEEGRNVIFRKVSTEIPRVISRRWKIFFSAKTIARIKIDELYMRESYPLSYIITRRAMQFVMKTRCMQIHKSER